MSATLSVVVRTHNRSKVLKNCLEWLAAQQFDFSLLEVIVVDNASTDATRDVVQDFSKGILPLQCVYEERLGLSRARATGFRNSRGRYIEYIDDGATAYPGWCAAIYEAFEQNAEAHRGRVAALGGPVELAFETERPPWLTAELELFNAGLDLGRASRPFPLPLRPVGANMAFRREILQHHPWDENVIMCEDVELFNRLAANGFTFLYAPAMRVTHFVPAARCTVEWILKRYYAEGLDQKNLRHGFLPKVRLLVKVILELLRSCAFLLFGDKQRRLFHRCKLTLQIGILEGFLNIGERSTVFRERFNPPKSG